MSQSVRPSVGIGPGVGDGVGVGCGVGVGVGGGAVLLDDELLLELEEGVG